MRTWILAAALALVGSSVISAPSEGPTANPCYLTVTVPVGATLTVNGARTEQMTAVRSFVSPPLPLNKKFYYTFEATYTSNTVIVIRKQQVEVTAGANLSINMLAAELVKPEAPKSKPMDSPFEQPKKK